MAHLTVGITTRDRWEELAVTLRELSGFLERSTTEVIVLDDGSSTPLPEALPKDYPRVRFFRFEESTGPIARRNHLGSLTASEYLMFIDDDSFPVAGRIEAAIAHLDGKPSLVGLALNVVARGSEKTPVSEDASPFPVQRFINCGAIVRRKQFLEVGGFRKELVYYGEEGEFAARAARAGLGIEFFPSLVIFHNRTPTARNSKRIAYFQGRNRVITVLWTYPLTALILRLPLSLPGTLLLVEWRDYPAAIGGFFVGVVHGIKGWRQRTPLAREAYLRFRRLRWVAQSAPKRKYMRVATSEPPADNVPARPFRSEPSTTSAPARLRPRPE